MCLLYREHHERPVLVEAEDLQEDQHDRELEGDAERDDHLDDEALFFGW